MTDQATALRIGARVLLLDEHDRVLLIHACDPDDSGHHWWELPGGGLDAGESLEQAAVREVAEETGIELDQLGPRVWIRESRFRYRNRDHHRIDHVFLACGVGIMATVATKPTENEKLGLIERAWLTSAQLHDTTDKLVPPELPTLLDTILAGNAPAQPIYLHG
jgi:8-oxo-dGTP pyrophosphatase MutT (NUDIX family)